jgi:hypothetical protein
MATTIEVTTAGTVVKSKPQARQYQGVFPYVIEATVTLTEASIAAGVVSQIAITIPGSKLGDFVEVSQNTNSAGAFLVGSVTATDTVTLTIMNLETVDANTTFSGGIVANVRVQGKRVGFATT